MAEKVLVPVTPTVVRWARERARMTVLEAADAADISVDLLESIEAGLEAPTVPQARRLADAYHRPLALFLLPEPPQGFTPIRDYRRLPGDEATPPSPRLEWLVRQARERRDLAIELMDLTSQESGGFDFRLSRSSDPEDAGTQLRQHLVKHGASEHAPTLASWRAAAEAAGVLVFGFSRIPHSEARGFSIAEHPLPAVSLNSGDNPEARTFTLLHELTHVALRRSGLCDLRTSPTPNPAENQTEVFCNATAAAALIPRSLLSADPRCDQLKAADSEDADADQAISALAKRFGVNREVVVRRLLTLGFVDPDFYADKRAQYAAQAAARKKKPTPGGPPIELRIVGSAGRAFTALVLGAYSARRITLSDVSFALDSQAKWIPRVERVLASRPRAVGE